MPQDAEEGRDAKIDAVVAEIVRLRESGHEVDLSAMLAKHPEIADSVEAFLKDQDFFDKAAGRDSKASVDTDADKARETRVRPEESDSQEPVGEIEPEPGTTSVLVLPAEFASGKQAFGRYHIEKLLGEGAMGAVYLAHDNELGRKVALKVPKFTPDNADRLGKRFRREAQAAAKLHHRNICPVYDVGRIDGVDYLTMAYIDGKPLSAYVRPEKPLAQRQIALVIRKLAMALQAAHDAGVVHRDLKPSNVIIDREGEPVVMDFGLAGRVDVSRDSRLTKSGTILGTPAYMSPEQIEGVQKLIGPRSDIYALGVVMFELLTGRLPFRGSPASVMGKVLVAKPPAIVDLRADADPQLAKICEAMMVKHPTKRVASMTEVADKLTHWIRQSRTAEQTAGTSTSTEPPPEQNIVTTGEEMAALPGQAASRRQDDSNEISDARKTHQVAPAGMYFKTKAWFNSLPPRRRWLVAAAGAALPLLLLGVTILIKITIDAEGNTKVSVTRDEDSSSPIGDAAATGAGRLEPQVAGTANPKRANEATAYGPYINLFNGAGTSEWEHLGVFRVEGDELVADRKGAAKSRRIFEDFELEFEWKLERDGNSGVYYRAYPGAAINIWPNIQSAEFALDATDSPSAVADNGAFWNVLAPVNRPPISPDQFHAGKIVCQGSHVEHWIDGTLVLKYDTSTASFRQTLASSKNPWFEDEGPLPSGRIYLQSNVGEIRFRNIRVREIISAKVSQESIAAAPSIPADPSSPVERSSSQHSSALARPQRFLAASNARRMDEINRAAGASQGAIEAIWVTSDGSDIYWQQGDPHGWGSGNVKAGIWQATLHRPSTGDVPAKRVSRSFDYKPSVTDDGLYMICTKHPATNTVYQASRAHKSQSFSDPTPISTLTLAKRVHGASVSPDGKTLVYSEGSGLSAKLFVCHRSSRSDSWGPAAELHLERDQKFEIGFSSPRISCA